MATVVVSKFSPDDAHIGIERIGQITTETQKAASIMATKLSDQELKKGDVSVETDSKLQKAIASAKKKCGFVGEYAEGAKDKLSTMKAQAGEVQAYAVKMYQGGKGAYKTYYSDPLNYVKSTKTAIFGQIRSIAGIRFKIDDLLIGEDARKLLMLGIKSVCGDGGLGIDGIYGAWKTLLDILDNLNLFSNSDLLKAIANCHRFTDDHVRVVSSKTTIVAENGNTVTYLEMVKIEDVTSTQGDILRLCKNSEDNAINADNIVMIYDQTGRPTASLITQNVMGEQMIVEEADPIQVMDLEQIAATGNKVHLMEAVVADNGMLMHPGTLNQATMLMLPSQEETLPMHATLQQARQSYLSSAQTLQTRMIANKELGMTVKTEIGPGRKINKTPLMEMVTSRITSSAAPSAWGSSSSEKINLPDMTAFDVINPLDEMKIQTGDFYTTKEPEAFITEKSNVYEGLDLIPFGTTSGLTVKPIKGWKKSTDSRGMELRIPVYA